MAAAITLAVTAATLVGCGPALAQVAQVATGSAFTCAVKSGGTVQCWGRNDGGELGDGTTEASSTPVDVADLTDIDSVSAGDGHACAVKAGGGVYCWGKNATGQLGNGTTIDSAVPVYTGISTAASVAAGLDSTCAVLQVTGAIQCWGSNFRGQVGDGTTVDRLAPTTVAGVTGATSVSVGDAVACATFGPTDPAKCWGFNSVGQLGDGTTTNSSVPVAVGAPSLHLREIASGPYHTCGRDDAHVYCWGLNLDYQLGDGTTTTRLSPVMVPTLNDTSPPAMVSVGRYGSCAVNDDGSMACWGGNGFGQLGDGTMTTRSTPVVVPGITGPTSLDLGFGHTCVTISDGSVRCWGDNSATQLGDRTTVSNNPSPTTANATRQFDNVTAMGGGYFHSCAIRDQQVMCWGYNGLGQVGNNSTTSVSVPVFVHAQDVSVSTGKHHSCALGTDGTITCWGLNIAGQIGNTSTTDSLYPQYVQSLPSPATSLTSGADHNCAVMTDTTVRCWGYGGWGQIGNGGTANALSSTLVPGLTGVVDVAGGEDHTCARLGDGSVKCWGHNTFGQTGQPTSTSSVLSPVTVPGVSGATAITAGGDHSCAAVATGIVCWGRNDYGQLGNGTTTSSSAPVNVLGSLGLTAVSAGAYHSCALFPISGGNAVRCWGADYSGQLGDRTTMSSATPLTVPNLAPVSAVEAGGSQTCVTTAVGAAMKCWGRGDHGQIGNGATANPMLYPSDVLTQRWDLP